MSERVAMDSVKLLNPFSGPKNIFAVGANYRGHILEARMQIPIWPSFPRVSADPTVLADRESSILLLVEAADLVDYEAELAVVIGIGGKDISAAEAWSTSAA
jgi:2-keto-4-pentenoate hydratase/2-oxohepta-3-ene-1,7-dioic acid hydratase in catechol pathway